ncbi:TonB-dependent receptor [Hydrocarboniphaga effusa]|jgi:iron complex outermembrane receptor protein|uniref:TonB-dependent receptor family protein n=1 Tax=Hydrocarboniphaga effusa TaxID=243629 RepID=UPI0031381ADB
MRSSPNGHRGRFRLSLLASGLLASLAAAAQDAATAEVAANDSGAPIETVTVTATRLAAPSYDTPASIDSVSGGELFGERVGVNLSEALFNVPGIVARDRQNYAQDTQISVRGFGTRSAFGLRGVRLYVDGIPATQPDGQGQVSHFNLATAKSVEILRGPFSSLYGNSSGGVIQMFTADGTETPTVSASTSIGSYGTSRSSVGTTGSIGIADYNLGYTHFETDGYRDHSKATRDGFNGKLNLQLNDAGKLTFLLNSFTTDADDPLGLTAAQAEENPRQVATQATQFDTRKSVDQTVGGVVYDLRISESQSLHVLGYYGQRDVVQFLAIPQGPQSGSAGHSGGVIDLGTDYGGVDARWAWRGSLAGRPASLIAGLTWDTLDQQRRGYENYVGTTFGVRGNLRRDEDNTVDAFEQYLQASWDFAEKWSAMAGLRHSQIDFESKDHYIVGTNLDDSYTRDYSRTTPVVGLMFRADPRAHFYASYGSGFETPTLAELAYRRDEGAGASGSNALDAARSQNYEIGAKLRPTRWLSSEIALFQTDTKGELAVASNSGGRSTYLNIDKSRRRGVELSADARLARLWSWQLAYTYLDAEVRQDYMSCSGTPCTALNTTVEAGNRIPGIARNVASTQLRFGGELGAYATLDARHVSSVQVNDTNTESADAYEVVDLGAGWRWSFTHWNLRAYARVDNVFDEDYIGSVIVNDGNGRYYEPAPDRTYLGGVAIEWKS